jgi:hypothetical protein
MRFSQLTRLWRNLLYGFRKELRPYESVIFECALRASSQSDQAVLRQQLAARERVQRWTSRVLSFSLPPGHQLPRIANASPNYCYATVRLQSPNGRLTAKFITHLGFLSTIEFSRNPVPLLSTEFSVTQVRLHSGGAGYAEEIDETEHAPSGKA